MPILQQIQRVLSKWEEWVGYLEKASRDYRYYDNKTANAGYNNCQRFSKGYDETAYGYSPVKDGYPWCATTVCNMFIESEGFAEADRLMCGVISRKEGAGCEQIHRAFAAQGRWFTSNPQIGDLVTFGDDDHIGIVRDVDSTYFYTYEGNTSSTPGVEPNGGGLFKKSYYKTSSYVNGYCRPAYKEDEDDMDQTKFNEMLNVALEQRNGANESDWSVTEGGWKALCNTISPVNGAPIFDGTAPQGFLTREQLAAVLFRLDLSGEQIIKLYRLLNEVR